MSMAVSSDAVYVLNAEKRRLASGLPGRPRPPAAAARLDRQLGLNPAATPQFVNTPGQVAFAPDGSKLIVTTKANGNDIDVFNVGLLGYLSTSPVVNAEPGTVPFAISFDRAGNLVIAEAGTNSLATFALNHDGTVTLLHSVRDRTGSNLLGRVGRVVLLRLERRQRFRDRLPGRAGRPARPRWVTATTDAGTVDAAASSDGRFLYVQAGGPGNVDAFRINSDGSLTALGSVTVPGAAGGEGIVAF